jgi:hypothetical protein
MSRHTCVFVVTSPLIPGFKTAVARYCRDPANGVCGGFIRWQSMDTIESVRLECCAQSERQGAIASVEAALVTIAHTLMPSTQEDDSVSVTGLPVEGKHDTLYNNFVVCMCMCMYMYMCLQMSTHTSLLSPPRMNLTAHSVPHCLLYYSS